MLFRSQIQLLLRYCAYAFAGPVPRDQGRRSAHPNLLLLPQYIHHSPGNSRRGFGIDCAILSCQVYISQILVASAAGAMVEAVGSVRVIPMVASGGSFLGFLTSCFLVIYPGQGGEGEASKGERKALTAPLGNGGSGNGVTEKPSVLKLTKKGVAKTTTCRLECESTL